MRGGPDPPRIPLDGRRGEMVHRDHGESQWWRFRVAALCGDLALEESPPRMSVRQIVRGVSLEGGGAWRRILEFEAAMPPMSAVAPAT